MAALIYYKSLPVMNNEINMNYDNLASVSNS